MKKFHVELTGFLEMDTDMESDARVLTEQILEEIRSVISGHGAILDHDIRVDSVTEKSPTRRYR